MARQVCIAGRLFLRRAAIIVLMAMPLLCWNRTAGAESPVTISAAMAQSRIYRADAWHPIHIELSNNTDQVMGGTVVLPLKHPQSPATMKLPLTLPPNARVGSTIWGYFPAPAPQQKSSGETPPLTVAEWRGRDGALLARSQILGIALSATAAAEESGDAGEVVLVVGQRADQADELSQPDPLLAHLKQHLRLPLIVASVDVSGLARTAVGLRSMKAIILDLLDPDSLDVAQRSALLEYVRGGGVVVMSAPVEAVARSGSWSQPLLPVRLVGTRVAGQIEVAPGEAPLKLRQTMPIVEAIEAGGGNVLLRGDNYVHVATRRIGLGKVVFTSFPINGLDDSQARVSQLWSQLLALDQPRQQWGASQLAEARYQVLGSMIGKKVAPWGVAAAVAGGYLLAILLAQGLFLGPSRPRAFAVTMGIAVALSATLAAMGMARREGQSLQAARLAIVDVSAEGGGWRQEAVAYVGAEALNMSLRAADERVMVRPALADEANPPLVRQEPFGIEQADVHGERIERVWEAAAPLDPRLRLSATGRFGPQGLTLEVDNGLDQPIIAPLVLWNQRALSFADVPPGHSESAPLRVNDRGDFTDASVVTSDQSRRRGLVVQASLTPVNSTAPRADSSPLLVGWIDDSADARLIRTSDVSRAEQKSLVMVRAPLRIEPTQPGSGISVPAALVEVKGRLPYDRIRAESVPSPQGGEWLVGFAVPPQIGQIRPSHATLEARVTLPGHVMVVRRGQCAGGSAQLNRNGDVVAEWGGEVGSKRLDIACSASDFDQSGCVWLLLEVRSSNPAGGGTPVDWQIKDLGMRIEAQAVAPPPPIVFEAAAQAESEESP